MMTMINYWLTKQAEFSATRGRMNITYYLGDKQTSDRVIKPLAEVNKELSICRDAINKFN